MAQVEQIQEELGEIFIADGVVEQLIYQLIAESPGLSPPNQIGDEDDLLRTLSKAYKGKGVKIESELHGGVVGIILDGRGRPFDLSDLSEDERVNHLKTWMAELNIYPSARLTGE